MKGVFLNSNLYTFLYGTESINHKLFMMINHASNSLFDVLMPVFTYLGDSWRIYPYLAILVVIFLIKRDYMPFRYIIVYCIASVLTIFLLEVLKGWLHVPRPAAAIGVQYVRVLGELKLKHSLPSGHATFSFMTAFVLSYKKGRVWTLALFSFAFLVAYSRIYVGAHYPLDVVAGGILGVTIGFIAWSGYEKLMILSKRLGG
jgi:undecaprenyl-diphosphatase